MKKKRKRSTLTICKNGHNVVHTNDKLSTVGSGNKGRALLSVGAFREKPPRALLGRRRCFFVQRFSFLFCKWKKTL